MATCQGLIQTRLCVSICFSPKKTVKEMYQGQLYSEARRKVRTAGLHGHLSQSFQNVVPSRKVVVIM